MPLFRRPRAFLTMALSSLMLTLASPRSSDARGIRHERKTLVTKGAPLALIVDEAVDTTGGATRTLEVHLRQPAARLRIDLEDYQSAKLLRYFGTNAGGFERLAVVRLEGGPAACYGPGPVYLVGLHRGAWTLTFVDVCNPNEISVTRDGADLVLRAPRWRNPRVNEWQRGDEIRVHERKLREREVP